LNEPWVIPTAFVAAQGVVALYVRSVFSPLKVRIEDLVSSMKRMGDRIDDNFKRVDKSFEDKSNTERDMHVRQNEFGERLAKLEATVKAIK